MKEQRDPPAGISPTSAIRFTGPDKRYRRLRRPSPDRRLAHPSSADSADNQRFGRRRHIGPSAPTDWSPASRSSHALAFRNRATRKPSFWYRCYLRATLALPVVAQAQGTVRERARRRGAGRHDAGPLARCWRHRRHRRRHDRRHPGLSRSRATPANTSCSRTCRPGATASDYPRRRRGCQGGVPIGYTLILVASGHASPRAHAISSRSRWSYAPRPTCCWCAPDSAFIARSPTCHGGTRATPAAQPGRPSAGIGSSRSAQSISLHGVVGVAPRTAAAISPPLSGGSGFAGAFP